MVSLLARRKTTEEPQVAKEFDDAEDLHYDGEVDLKAVGKSSKAPFFILVGGIFVLVFGTIGFAVVKHQPAPARTAVVSARPVSEIAIQPAAPPGSGPEPHEPDALSADQPPPFAAASAEQAAESPATYASPAGPSVGLPALTAEAPPPAQTFPITPPGTSTAPAAVHAQNPAPPISQVDADETTVAALKVVAARLDALESRVGDLSRLEASVRHIEELAEQIRSGMAAMPRPQSKPVPAGKPMAQAAPSKPTTPKVKVAAEQRHRAVSAPSKVLVKDRAPDCTLLLVDDGTEEATIRSDGSTRTYRTGEFAPCVGTIRRVEYRDEAFVVTGSRGQLELRAR
jgi:hypothetical protein